MIKHLRDSFKRNLINLEHTELLRKFRSKRQKVKIAYRTLKGIRTFVKERCLFHNLFRITFFCMMNMLGDEVPFQNCFARAGKNLYFRKILRFILKDSEFSLKSINLSNVKINHTNKEENFYLF